MAAGQKEALRNTLDNLSGAEFKRFKHHLKDQGLIPWRKLEKADTDDTVDLMAEVYTMGAGVVMVTILKTMNHNQAALDLETNLGQLGPAGGEGVRINMNISGWMKAPSVSSGSINCPLTFGRPPLGHQGTEHPYLQSVLSSHKVKMEKRVKYICEGMEKTKEKPLEKIYTQLYIVEGKTESVNDEHEVWQIETLSRPKTSEERAINCNDIFMSLPGQNKDIRAVLTMGVAGIGKTVSVQKFILDWAEGKANPDVAIMLMLTFRELNLLKTEYSLHNLLCDFYPELKKLSDTSVYDDYKTVIILDGLDESRSCLDFNKEIVASVTKPTSIDVLITSIIRGKLLPSALVWVTSRPAAVNQIPSEYIDQVTEVRGFTNAQKEEYFRRRIENEIHANKIVSHIKTSRTLYIMCHIPVFCWVLATVLQKLLTEDQKEELPKTVTEMYIHFLLIQTNIKNQKYHGRYETDKQRLLGSHKDTILNLAKLAFTHLDSGKLLFYEENLKECGIDVTEDSVYSGMCAEILREDSVFFERKVYCFVHLSIQEFLAALFVFHAYVTGNHTVLESFRSQRHEYLGSSLPLFTLLKSAMDKALDSKNGHLDLFLRFLLGITLESNQTLLQGLLPNMLRSSGTIGKTCEYIKQLKRKDPSPERCLNLLHCLFEMSDHSLHDEVQEYLKSATGFSDGLSPLHCSALADILLMSEKVLNELDLRKYNTSDDGRMRLVPAIRYCRKAKLSGCYLTEKACEIVAYAMHSANSPLRELDLSHNDLVKSEETILSALQSPTCTLEKLRLSGCHLTDKAYEALASALPSCTELDLGYNDVRDSGLHLLSAASCSLQHKLQILRVNQCYLTKASCEMMASMLQSTPSHLRELDMSNNDLQDGGVGLLCVGLRHPQCQLEILKVKQCHLAQGSCKTMATVLQGPPNSLRVLDMSSNDLQDEGVELLCAGLRHTQCQLETLRLSGCLITHKGCFLLASALKSNPSHLKELDLSYNHPGDLGVKELTDRLNDPNCNLETFQFDHGARCRLKPQLTKYACKLTLDPDTACREVVLSQQNTQVTASCGKQPYPDNPIRFDCNRQVLCKETLFERCFWEVEWTGTEVDVAVAYGSIERKGGSNMLTWNDKAWSLTCFDGGYKVCHNKTSKDIPAPSSSSSRVGVYLDWPAGTLSFYSISSYTLTHLHTFHATFTEPLYPGFKVGYAYEKESSASLYQITDGPESEEEAQLYVKNATQ